MADEEFPFVAGEKRTLRHLRSVRSDILLRLFGSLLLESLVEFSVLSPPIGVPSDVHDVTVVEDSVDGTGSHHFVPKNLSPLIEGLV